MDQLSTVPSTAPNRGQAGKQTEIPHDRHGTTTLALKTADGVVLAADRRATLGGRIVSSKDAKKVFEVHPNAAMALAGSVGGLQVLARSLRTRTRLYESRRGKPMSMTALATETANVLRNNPSLLVSSLLGGFDPIDEESYVFDFDGAGGMTESEYAASGSGMQFVYGVLENEFENGLGREAAVGLATDAISAASERDTASGNGMTFAAIDSEGVEITTEAVTAEVL